ncbi:hypothetical protein [Nonomuraea salmonea]|uniref:hypothetical protein n=1 Tax=Nonomuraea salmonea TaxID=46181 RepID=UPI0031F1845A
MAASAPCTGHHSWATAAARLATAIATSMPQVGPPSRLHNVTPVSAPIARRTTATARENRSRNALIGPG